jgi:probable phosphoglycerate mutase
MPSQLWLIRHGETEWTLSGAHTGSTDIPLTDAGRRQALKLKQSLAGRRFALVLASPLSRARETCNLAGFGGAAQIDPNLVEWRYGDYEGRTTAQIHAEAPGWSLWRAGVPNGEPIAEVAARANCVIRQALRTDGDVALFGHGHILRILTACWLELPPECGRLFALDTADIGVLGYEHDDRVISRWNANDECRKAVSRGRSLTPGL